MIFGLAGPAAAAPPVQPPTANAVQLANATAPINATLQDGSTFVGSFSPSGFAADGGALTVSGVLTGTYTDAATGIATPITQTVQTTVDAASNTSGCDILTLVLGPLHLDVLGLVVDLNQVELDITAVPGAGNLLGNLLCAVTGLLDGSGLSGLAGLLNRLLGL